MAVRIVQTYVGCVRATGARAALGSAPPSHTSEGGCFPDTCFVSAIRVRGGVVGYGDNAYGRFGVQSYVVVRDLVRSVVVHRIPDGTDPYDPAVCDDETNHGIGPVTDLVLGAHGRPGWIVQRLCTPGGTQPYEVHAPSAQGQDRVLAQGTDIEPESLVLRGTTLSWMRDGSPQQARF